MTVYIFVCRLYRYKFQLVNERIIIFLIFLYGQSVYMNSNGVFATGCSLHISLLVLRNIFASTLPLFALFIL